MSEDRVTYRQHENLAVLTLDDGKANALGYATIQALFDGLDRAEKEAKAVVITGRPGRFSAGFDMKVMTSGSDAAIDLVARGAELFLRLFEYPLPIVAACTGHAVAGGAIMLLVADTRIGIEGDFRIGLNEVAIGMTLPIFGVELARARLNPRYTTRCVVQSQLLNPSQACDAGFLDLAVPAEKLEENAVAIASELAKISGPAYAATKLRLRKAVLDHVRETFDTDRKTWSLPSAK